MIEFHFRCKRKSIKANRNPSDKKLHMYLLIRMIKDHHVAAYVLASSQLFSLFTGPDTLPKLLKQL